MSSGSVAVLFARADSVYKRDQRCDAYDIDRDARTWRGGSPVVAHPPCRAWGRLRTFAKPREDEKALAIFAVEQVRAFGGVLEHPECSSLWAAAGLPRPGAGCDAFGGWTLPLDQFWFGHAARKRTWLYIVGVVPAAVPLMPLVLGDAPCVVSSSLAIRADGRRRKSISKVDRERTPQLFATWLVDLASLCASGSTAL